MADLGCYEIVGGMLLCRTCGKHGTRYLVKNFDSRTIDVAEMYVEIGLHETDRHKVVFKDNATENAETAKRASQELAKRADDVTWDMRESEYFRCYPAATAHRDGMVNGMGGASGAMAGFLGPEAVRALSKALERVAEMGKDYPELIQDHNRKTCDDFMCFIYGDLIDAARAVDSQLPR